MKKLTALLILLLCTAFVSCAEIAALPDEEMPPVTTLPPSATPSVVPTTEPTDMEMTVSIHPDLPDVILRLTAVRTDSAAEGDITLCTLTAIDAEGEELGCFPEVIWPDELNEEAFGLISFIDVNFDGYLDIEIWQGTGTWDPYTHYIVWDVELGCYVEDPYNMDWFGIIDFDSEKKLITEYRKSGPYDNWTFTHKYLDGVLTLVEEHAGIIIYDYGDDEEIDQQIIELLPERTNSDYRFIMANFNMALDYETMELEVTQAQFSGFDFLELSDDGIDANSPIGKALTNILNWNWTSQYWPTESVE